MQRVIRFVLAQMVLACCVPVRLWSQNLLSNGSFDKPAQGVPFVHGSFLHRFVQLAREILPHSAGPFTATVVPTFLPSWCLQHCPSAKVT